MKSKIKELIKKGENKKLEFKESLSLKQEIGECVSGFANTGQGIILVGVSDKGEIKRIDIGKKTIENLANYIKQTTENQVYPEIEIEKIDNKNIIVINVDESDEKPVFFKGVAYKRVGKSVHKLSASEVRKLAKESSGSHWDYQICKDSKLSDFDKKKINWYLKQREKHRNISKKLKISVSKFLENIKATKNKKPTNSGILFFANNPQKFFIRSQLRLVRFKGKNITNPIIDRLDCSGALWEMVDQSEDFLKKHINFMGFRTDKSFQREDKFDIPIEALRELIINALIHRDYETSGDVRVFIFDERVEIINPGSFPKGVTPKNPKHKPVNEILSQYMHDVGFIEKYGSGIMNVRELLKKNGNKDLRYVLHEIETKAIVYSQVFEKVGEKVSDRVGEEWSEKWSEKWSELTERQISILKLIQEIPKISRKEIAHNIGINQSAIQRHLEKLKQKGILKRVGPAKGGYWEVVG